jgi:hypothetical protein
VWQWVDERSHEGVLSVIGKKVPLFRGRKSRFRLFVKEAFFGFPSR